ncbi:MAG: hypothetical protein ACR2OX_02730 [Methyloligellaceae bacterium]
MTNNAANDELDDLKLEILPKKPVEHRNSAFLVAVLVSLAIHGTVAAALLKGILG